MSKKSEREWDKLQEEVKKNQLERLKKKEKELQNDERPELRETASQVQEKISKVFMDGVREGKKHAERMAGFQEGLREAEEARRDKVDLSKIEDEDEKRLIIRYQIIDELFDELLAKLLTFMEACGFCADKDESRYAGKSWAIRKTFKSMVREIQDRIKDEVPITEKMLDVSVTTDHS